MALVTTDKAFGPSYFILLWHGKKFILLRGFVMGKKKSILECGIPKWYNCDAQGKGWRENNSI